jgi:hypothetical protein
VLVHGTFSGRDLMIHIIAMGQASGDCQAFHNSVAAIVTRCGNLGKPNRVGHLLFPIAAVRVVRG